MISKQETFDTVVAHLRKQGKRATKKPDSLSPNSCAYRLDDLKCAAGCLIPDDKYDPAMEGHSVTHRMHNQKLGVVVMIPSLAGKVIKELGHDLDLVRDLQSIHDISSPDTWEHQFREMATANELEYKEPNSV